MMRRVGTALMLAALGGCAVAPVAPPPFVPADPSAFVSWTATGRLALAANGEGGSGSFTWQQQAGATTVSLRGPLGAGAMRVTVDGDRLSVTDGDGRSLDTLQTRSLLRERLGADLPWNSLRFWMLGIPAPDGPARVADADRAPLRVIEQADWRIGYDAFRPTLGASLPTRFTATRDGVRLKVTVDEWQVTPVVGHGP
jgi:outer membrane lipoprotein LolB